MLPPYKARAEIDVSAMLAGAATPGRRERVEFAPMDLDVPWVAPLPRERDTSEYFVVSFLTGVSSPGWPGEV